jgi:hypothetical protein
MPGLSVTPGETMLVPVGDISVGDIPVGDIPVGDVPVGDISVGDVPVGDISVGDIPVGDIPVGDVAVGDIPVGDVAVPTGVVAPPTPAPGEVPVSAVGEPVEVGDGAWAIAGAAVARPAVHTSAASTPLRAIRLRWFMSTPCGWREWSAAPRPGASRYSSLDHAADDGHGYSSPPAT